MSKLRVVILLAMLLAMAPASFLPSAGPTVTAAAQSMPSGATAPVPDRARVAAALQSAPVMFVENAGQLSEGARFQVQTGSGAIYLAEDAIWFTAKERPAAQRQPRTPDPRLSGREAIQDSESTSQPGAGVNLKVSFPGANPGPTLETFNLLETRVSSFIGSDPAKWRTDLPVWGGVRYVDLYPGIDLEVTGEDGRLVQRVVSRGGDLSGVRLRVEGADSLAVVGGSLQVASDSGHFALPLLQLTGDRSSSPVSDEPRINAMEVTAPFATGSGPQARTAASGASDLSYSTFLGGGDWDGGEGIAVDGSGAAYVTGGTSSSNFPSTPGAYDPSSNGGSDAFVAKLNPAGSALAYLTFLGGTEWDGGDRIAIDGSGAAYVMGFTTSFDFPATPGSLDTIFNGSRVYRDAFVAKLNPTGSALVYSTFLGGRYDEYGYGIAVDGSGAAYVTGFTLSSDFPTTAGAYDESFNGGVFDAFVAKLNPAGSALAYSTFLGGSGGDVSSGIAVDGSGAAYVTGGTDSPGFPTTPGAYDTDYFPGNGVAFVAKLNPAGSGLAYATFLSGSYGDFGRGIAVDGSGAAYVTGETWSSDFPTTAGAYDTSANGEYDVFVAKLNPAGSGLGYATLLGGSGGDLPFAIALDGKGSAYVTGYTYSHDFPTTVGAYDASYNGDTYDVFVVKLNSAGSVLAYSTFLGGSRLDWAYGIAVDGRGAAYVTGFTWSSDFPTTPSAYDTSFNGGTLDGFVAKLYVPELYVPSPAADVSAAKIGTPSPILVGQPLTYTITVSNNGPDPASNVAMTDALPAGVTFSSVSSSQGSCTQTGRTVNCPLGSLANGRTATAVVVVTATVLGTITNIAAVAASEYDANPVNNTAMASTEVTTSLPTAVTLSDFGANSGASQLPLAALGGVAVALGGVALWVRRRAK